MKNLVQSICAAVKASVVRGIGGSIIRLDGFSSPQVYLLVCRELQAQFLIGERPFSAHLAYKKYEEFSASSENLPVLKELVSAGWVDLDNRMTYWRNRSSADTGIILLMGTEAVEDRGGLADFYTITPSVIEQRLNGDYARWFEPIVSDTDIKWKTILNESLETLFKYVPTDLCKLSMIVDEFEARGSISSTLLMTELLSRLYRDWNFPCIKSTAVHRVRLKLIEQAAKFRNRTNYKDGLTATQLRRIQSRIDRFKSDNPYIDQDPQEQFSMVFRSFDDFASAIKDYAAGISLDVARDRLFRCDFGLINDVLSISPKKPVSEKNITPKIHGDPLEVFLKIMLLTLKRRFDEGLDTQRLVYEIVEGQLAECTTPEELRNHWFNIVSWSGGLLDFLAQENWLLSGSPVELMWKDNLDALSPPHAENMIEMGVVKRASAARKLNRFLLRVTASPGDQEYLYVWEFDPLSKWVHAFVFLLDNLRDAMEELGQGYIPFGTCVKVPELVQSSNEDDFLAIIGSTNVEFFDILKTISERLPSSADEIVLRTVEIGKAFVSFSVELWSNGFYHTFSKPDATGLKLVTHYAALMTYLSQGTFNSMVEEQLYLLANAFIISPSLKNGVEDPSIGCGIVPPFHPAMLEKMHAQAQFIRQAAVELLERLQRDPKLKVELEFERFLQLSTITSAVDVLIGAGGKSLPVQNCFAYHCLYHNNPNDEFILSSLTSGTQDIVADEELNLAELKRETPLSRLFARQVVEYLDIFPFHADELSLLFMNPSDLQPVVAAVHQVVQGLKKTQSRVRMRLYVAISSAMKGARGYLRYWLDNFFSEEDNVSIQTSCISMDLARSNHGDLLGMAQHVDITFVQNPLTSELTRFEPMHQDHLPVSDCRFPMVYQPLPISRTTVRRLISASQTQFQAAHLHTQLVRKIINKHLLADNYRMVKEMVLSAHWKSLISALHDVSNWVVCVDAGIDRYLLPDEQSRIISFSTGEGPFGEYNYTVSTNRTIQHDIGQRLKNQLRRKFPLWPEASLQDVAVHCLRQARALDGIRLLRALNPNDFEVHSFLAYILTAQECGVIGEPKEETAIRTLISLDAYAHWFNMNDSGIQPDFLLLEIPKGDSLEISATLIECKMGAYSEVHIDKACRQLIAGYKHLSKCFDPKSQAVDRRYWFAQLYRVLVFSKINFEDNSPKYEQFVKRLNGILSGDFSINWNLKTYAFWLDVDYYSQPIEVFPGPSDIELQYYPFGQLYVQKMLRSPEHREEVVTFLEPVLEDDLEYAGTSEDEPDGSEIDVDSLDSIVNKVDIEPVGNSAPNYIPDLKRDLSNDSDQHEINAIIGKEHDDHLESVRVLIGEDIRTREKVYWEYGHLELPNRHILISGNSGTGKTYLIQAMMLELVRAGISCMVFDYTDGFTESKLEPEFKESLKERIREFPVYLQPFPVNPFKRHDIIVAGSQRAEKVVDVAERIMGVFRAVYSFGDQQASAIYRATRNGLDKYGDDMNLNRLREELVGIVKEIPNSKTVLSKIEPLVDREPFDFSHTQDWGNILAQKGTVFIIQLSGFTRDVQLIITEMILWDAWYYNLKHGRKDLPFPVILDEAQNLDHGSGSPSTKILTEGRKFGWSGWFATQFMKTQLEPDEIQRLQQSSQKVYFNPPEAEIPDIATNLEPDRSKRAEWQIKLAQLRKGECVVAGYELKGGKLDKRPPRIVRVMSFEERGRS